MTNITRNRKVIDRVTIEIKRGTEFRVLQWCFKNLSRPAYLAGRARGEPLGVEADFAEVYRKHTLKQMRFSHGTVEKERHVMTMFFTDKTDAIMFSTAWGSIPVSNDVSLKQFKRTEWLLDDFSDS